MLQFDYATSSIERIDLRDELADAQHRMIMAPIVIRTYGSRAHSSGHVVDDDRNDGHERYVRAWRREHRARFYTNRERS